MEILDNYLDTMFSRYPLTPRTQEAKRELRAMMEDAYNGALAAGHSQNEAIGQAIAEFGNIEEVAPILGLMAAESQFPQPWAGTDTVAGSTPAPTSQTLPLPTAPADPYSPRDYPESTAGTSWGAEQTSPYFSASNRKTITLAQARNFAETKRRTRWLLAAGVAIIVLAPGPLLALVIAAGETENTRQVISLIIGFVVLAPLLGVGIGLLIYRGQLLRPFSRITAQTDLCTPEVEAYAKALRAEHAATRTKALIIAIALWILAAVPVISTALLTQNQDQTAANPLLGMGMAVSLVLVALGLLVFLSSNWADSAANELLATSPEAVEEEYEESDISRYPAWARAVFAGYWPLVTTIYLAWSFISWNWHITWIVWPISAVAFGAFSAIVAAVYPSGKSNSY